VPESTKNTSLSVFVILLWFVVEWFVVEWFVVEWFIVEWFIVEWFIVEWFIVIRNKDQGLDFERGLYFMGTQC